MSSDLKPGLRHVQTLPVDQSMTAPAVSPAFGGFADTPPVLATAFMVGFIEWACIEALKLAATMPARSAKVFTSGPLSIMRNSWRVRRPKLPERRQRAGSWQ
jgi:hypothetical protein